MLPRVTSCVESTLPFLDIDPSWKGHAPHQQIRDTLTARPRFQAQQCVFGDLLEVFLKARRFTCRLLARALYKMTGPGIPPSDPANK